MQTKTALVSGGTSGVGLSIVRELAKQNFNVFFIGTNSEKGKKIEEELKAKTKTEIRFIQLDLSDFKKVKSFCENFLLEVTQLDLLANVAGVVLPKQQITNEGLDKTFTIGYLSSFLLTNALLPLLKKSLHSRIANVSGSKSFVLKKRLDFDNFNFEKNYNAIKTSVATVHAKTVWTEILAEKLKDENIDVNAFHPGTVKSDLTRNLPFPLPALSKLAHIFMADVSANGLYVCLSEKVKGISGKLFIKQKAYPINFDKAYKERLWAETEKILKKI